MAEFTKKQINLINQWKEDIIKMKNIYSHASLNEKQKGHWSNIAMKTMAGLSGTTGIGFMIARYGTDTFLTDISIYGMNFAFSTIGAILFEYNFNSRSDKLQNTANDCSEYINKIEKIMVDDSVDETEACEYIVELECLKNKIVTEAIPL